MGRPSVSCLSVSVPLHTCLATCGEKQNSKQNCQMKYAWGSQKFQQNLDRSIRTERNMDISSLDLLNIRAYGPTTQTKHRETCQNWRRNTVR